MHALHSAKGDHRYMYSDLYYSVVYWEGNIIVYPYITHIRILCWIHEVTCGLRTKS